MATHQRTVEIPQEIPQTDKSIFGFWLYLMTDCVLFATLFATYVVLRTGTNGGPDQQELFSLPFVFIETILLLTSSLTSGLALLAIKAGRKQEAVRWFIATFILGASFVMMELYEFNELIAAGHSWTHSGFLSAYFTLVGTHGLHIIVGLLWLGAIVLQLTRKGITGSMLKRATLFSMFWHFLDVIWIMIFTIVYLFGAKGV